MENGGSVDDTPMGEAILILALVVIAVAPFVGFIIGYQKARAKGQTAGIAILIALLVSMGSFMLAAALGFGACVCALQSQNYH